MTKKKKIIEPEYHEKERSKRKIRLVYYRKVAMVNQKTCSKKISALLLLLVNERLAAERNFKIKLHFIWCGSASKATLNTFITRAYKHMCMRTNSNDIIFARVGQYTRLWRDDCITQSQTTEQPHIYNYIDRNARSQSCILTAAKIFQVFVSRHICSCMFFM